MDQGNFAKKSVCIISSCQMASLGLRALLPQGTEIIPASNNINMTSVALNDVFFLCFIPNNPLSLLDVLREITEIINRENVPLKILIFSRAKTGWILNTLRNQVNAPFLLKYIHIISPDVSNCILSSLLHTFLFNSFPERQHSDVTTTRAYHGLTKAEFNIMLDIFKGHSVMSLAKKYGKSPCTLYAQRLSATKKMGPILSDDKWSEYILAKNSCY